MVWETFVRTRADQLEEYEREVYLGKVSRIETEFPKQLREILAESLYRLIDYQDAEYADRYIDDVREVLALDESMKGNLKLTEHFARNLALS